MSMQTLTILQFIGILTAYLGMTVLLPAFVFYRKVSEERFCVRFMIYFVIGNVYLMNLVMILQLLHISHWVTLFLGTVFPAVWTLARVHNTTVKDGVISAAKAVNSFLSGTMGGRLLLSKTLRFFGGLWKKGFLNLARSIRHNFFDWVAVIGIIMLVFWQYGCNRIWNMGYCFSDMPVHTYWVNAMNRNEIYIAGVYPFGFHSIIYYLHEMFGIYTYVLFRLFGLAEVLLIHLVLLAFLKACCKVKYTPYIAMVLYLAADIWNDETYNRYCGTLPQEFGMIFILPAVYFLFAFFADRKKENGAKGRKVHSTRYLIYFGLSFSATLAVHFYNTMIAGLFCMAVAVGFLGLLFRKEYFGRILLTGILSVLLAVLPMAAAFAMGKPPEGSLRWGLSIISGANASSGDSDDREQEDTEEDSRTDTSGGEGADTTGQSEPDTSGGEGADTTGQSEPDTSAQGEGENSHGTPSLAGTETQSPDIEPPAEIPKPPKQPLGVRLKTWIKGKWNKTTHFLEGLVFTMNAYVLSRILVEAVPGILIISVCPILLGLYYLGQRRTRHYGSMLISVAFCMVFLYMMMMSSWLGLPSLMDQNRCRIYIAYMLMASVAMALDGMISFFVGWITTQTLADAFSLGIVGFISGVLIFSGAYRQPINMKAFESNEAITCLTNILKSNRRFHFTVVSANDELRMVENDGYHYEIIHFLRSMEGENQAEYMTIPTPKIYFFIEKIPVDYGVNQEYEGSGRRVSREGAKKPLPNSGGLSVYQKENRYTVMSRMYYWVQEFQALYPNEMRIYYETDNFICYEVDQNPYRLFDLSIDYGYNSMEY